MSQRENLRAAVIANRRMLKLLDQQIEEVMKIEPEVFAELADPDRHQPFSYIVEGADKEPGIPTSGAVGYQNPHFGYIRIQSDAAFVATRLFVCVQMQYAVAPGPIYGRPKLADATEAEAAYNLSFRAYDESAGRWLLLANSRERVQQDAAVPGTLFGQIPLASAGGIELPTECVFPRNGLIRVEAYLLQLNAFSVIPTPRIYFIMHGYKVFGG